MSWNGRRSAALDISGNLGSTKKKKPIWKYVLLAIFLAIVGSGLWVGYSGWKAIKNITSGSSKKSSFFKFIGGYSPQQLEGENNDRINILLVGIGGAKHPAGTLSDTVMMLSIKPKEKKFAFISIPRDLYVKIPGAGYNKINYAHAYGEMNKKQTGGGPEVLSKVVSEVTGQKVHYYIRGDFDGFKQVVDSLDGISIDVPKAIYDPYYPDEKMKGYSPFRIKAGLQTMNGAAALKYARSRETTSDFDRAKRQQLLLLAIKDKAGSAGILANPKKIIDLINAVGDHLLTNFSPEELTRLVEIVKDVNQNNIKQYVIDNGTDGILVSSTSKATGYILKPRAGDYSEIHQITKNIFENDSHQSIKVEKALVTVLNGTGTSGTATDVAKILSTYGMSATPSYESITPRMTTTIYDYSAGKKKHTSQFLADKFKIKVIKKDPDPALDSNPDFEIILGSSCLDYLKTGSP